MAEICPMCGDNRSLQNHDLCSQCATDQNLVGGPRVDLTPEEEHKLYHARGEMAEGQPGEAGHM